MEKKASPYRQMKNAQLLARFKRCKKYGAAAQLIERADTEEKTEGRGARLASTYSLIISPNMVRQLEKCIVIYYSNGDYYWRSTSTLLGEIRKRLHPRNKGNLVAAFSKPDFFNALNRAEIVRYERRKLLQERRDRAWRKSLQLWRATAGTGAFY